MPKNGKTQKTKPKKGKPLEIPVPTRDEVLSDLEKVAKPRKDSTDRKR